MRIYSTKRFSKAQRMKRIAIFLICLALTISNGFVKAEGDMPRIIIACDNEATIGVPFTIHYELVGADNGYDSMKHECSNRPRNPKIRTGFAGATWPVPW